MTFLILNISIFRADMVHIIIEKLPGTPGF